jgi:hypothetical protein
MLEMVVKTTTTTATVITNDQNAKFEGTEILCPPLARARAYAFQEPLKFIFIFYNSFLPRISGFVAKTEQKWVYNEFTFWFDLLASPIDSRNSIKTRRKQNEIPETIYILMSALASLHQRTD